MQATLDPISTVEQLAQQKKKNKNKNKKEKEKLRKANEGNKETGGQKQVVGSQDISETSLYEKLSKLISATMNNTPNFEKLDEYETLIEQEINAIQELLDKVSKDQFNDIPDEQREIPKHVDEETFTQVTQKSPKHAKGLHDLKDKIDFLKIKQNDVTRIETYFPNDQRMNEILKSVRSNLEDDANRNQEVFNLLVTSILGLSQ